MKRLAGVIVALAMLVGASACDSDDGSASKAQGSHSNATAPNVAKPKPTLDGAAPQAAAPADAECKKFDLGSTAFGPFIQKDVIPAKMGKSGSDSFTFAKANITDNQFDPCAAFSWIVAEGIISDMNGPAGSNPKAAPVVLFFKGQEFIKSFDSPLYESIKSVKKLSDDSIEVVYSDVVGTRAEGEKADFRTAYKLSGDTVTTAETADADVKNRIHITFPGNARGCQPQRKSYGNVYGQSFQKEIQPLYANNYEFTVPMSDGQKMYCAIADKIRAFCAMKPNPGWKEWKGDPTKVEFPTPQLGGNANSVQFTFGTPTNISEVSFNDSTPDVLYDSAKQVAENGITKVGEIYVYTTKPGKVYFTNSFSEEPTGVIISREGVSFGE